MFLIMITAILVIGLVGSASAYEMHLKLGEDTGACSDNTLTLNNINSPGEEKRAVVDVVGVQETVTATPRKVNGLGVTILDTFYSDTREERSANLDIDYGTYFMVGETKEGVTLVNVAPDSVTVEMDISKCDDIKEVRPVLIYYSDTFEERSAVLAVESSGEDAQTFAPSGLTSTNIVIIIIAFALGVAVSYFFFNKKK